MVSISKLIIYGLVGAFAVSALINPARASGTVQAFGGIGTALGNLGTGSQTLLTGVGTGISKLFNPLFTLRDLIYAPQGGKQPTKDVQELSSVGQITSEPQEIATISRIDVGAPPAGVSSIFASSSGVTRPFDLGFSTGPKRGLPLTPAAVEYYERVGVAVSPSNTQTVQAQNSSNATTPGRSGGIVSRRTGGQSSGFARGAGFGAAN